MKLAVMFMVVLSSFVGTSMLTAFSGGPYEPSEPLDPVCPEGHTATGDMGSGDTGIVSSREHLSAQDAVEYMITHIDRYYEEYWHCPADSYGLYSRSIDMDTADECVGYATGFYECWGRIKYKWVCCRTPDPAPVTF